MYPILLLQDSKTPMPAEDINAIWEETKDMGVLFGKGGLYGNVSREDRSLFEMLSLYYAPGSYNAIWENKNNGYDTMQYHILTADISCNIIVEELYWFPFHFMYLLCHIYYLYISH